MASTAEDKLNVHLSGKYIKLVDFNYPSSYIRFTMEDGTILEIETGDMNTLSVVYDKEFIDTDDY